jgi:hypothetical protein
MEINRKIVREPLLDGQETREFGVRYKLIAGFAGLEVYKTLGRYYGPELIDALLESDDPVKFFGELEFEAAMHLVKRLLSGLTGDIALERIADLTTTDPVSGTSSFAETRLLVSSRYRHDGADDQARWLLSLSSVEIEVRPGEWIPLCATGPTGGTTWNDTVLYPWELGELAIYAVRDNLRPLWRRLRSLAGAMVASSERGPTSSASEGTASPPAQI